MRVPKPAEGGYATLYSTMKEVRAVGGYRIDSPTGPDFSTTEAKTDSFKSRSGGLRWSFFSSCSREMGIE